MCLGGKKQPEPQRPAPAPAPAEQAASVEPAVSEESLSSKAKRTGRSSLRIDATGPKIAGSSGLNIPQG